VVTVTLLADLDKVEKKTSTCTISRITKQLSAKEAEALIKVIDDPESSPTSLARILAKNGFNVSRQSINRHRKRGIKELGCACP
jgi:PleD family two-component response regulator